jgi:hypothetical protein
MLTIESLSEVLFNKTEFPDKISKSNREDKTAENKSTTAPAIVWRNARTLISISRGTGFI